MAKLTKSLHANGTQQDYRSFVKPEYVGPGIWILIHKKARAAVTDKKKAKFIKLMAWICKNFPCHTCANHCAEYYRENPPTKFMQLKVLINNQTEELGMFVWSWYFHNAVNARIGKPIMTFETAYQLFTPVRTVGLDVASIEQPTHTRSRGAQFSFIGFR